MKEVLDFLQKCSAAKEQGWKNWALRTKPRLRINGIVSYIEIKA